MHLLTIGMSSIEPTITAKMLEPVVDGLTANISVILPVGLSIFATFLGIKILPKLIKKFTN